ncbi:MAG: beta-galactosidase, partial [Candidatus Hydrogenedentes bacterium]|nr:beta-galactosidase [Candidatus Hydrogenedentota bacterium]
MNNSQNRICVCLLLFSPWAFCEPNSFLWDASRPDAPGPIQLVNLPDAAPVWSEFQGKRAVGAPSHSDYYQRRGLLFRVEIEPSKLTDPIYVVLEHLDRNLALIEVNYDGARSEAEPLAGYTSLGSGHPRRAVFRLTKPEFRHRLAGGADLEVQGVGALTGMTLTSEMSADLSQSIRNEVPAVVPSRITLRKPIQLVLSVGADSKLVQRLPEALSRMREVCPLAAALGFNAVESYVKWNFVETEKNRYDWSYYDAVVEEARRHGLKWFPLLIVGSAYALPQWFHDSQENVGFVCLEHGKRNNIQTIFTELQTPYVQSFLREFGKHYGSTGRLLGVRLGPSGNFGESQYPAGGNWGYQGETEHIHIGWWAGDPYAAPHFRSFLNSKYSDIHSLNRAWTSAYNGFDQVPVFIPQFAESKRQRKDFVDWYIGAMTDWCERWAVWARESMPDTPIYQSSGGWGFVESGTDFTEQTKSMVKVHGGIRATNETDSYVQNFYATRMMSSAARFYGVPFGAEPAGYGSARGVVARIYNILVNNGQHLFFYSPNLFNNDQAVEKWLQYAPLLDRRDEPLLEVAALYPDTYAKLDDGVFRNLYSFGFNRMIVPLREKLDFDFCSERMIMDGALPRYKVLLFLWSHVIEADVLAKIDQWVRD